MNRRNPCFDHPTFKAAVLVQEGWVDSGPTRFPVMREIPFRMSPDCIYSRDGGEIAQRGRIGAFDPGCEGCRWKQEPKE